MMFADQQYHEGDTDQGKEGAGDENRPLVTVENWEQKEYTVINIRSKNHPNLVFDTVCTITDMQYVIFHATINAEGPQAYQVSPLTFTTAVAFIPDVSLFQHKCLILACHIDHNFFRLFITCE